MCFYMNITCPGNCGILVSSNQLIASCKLFNMIPRPSDYEQVHSIEHGMAPLLPIQVEDRLRPGYACSEPTCSYHPGALTATLDQGQVFRCPGCGTVHSYAHDVWVETWVAPNTLVPFVDKTQYSEFACSQKNFCHFNPAYAQQILDKVSDAEIDMLTKHVWFDAALSDDQNQDVQDGQDGQNVQSSSEPKRKQASQSTKRTRKGPRVYQWILPKPAQ